jgi:hypothetical protein
MRKVLWSVAGLILFAGPQGADDSPDQIKAKLTEVRKRLDELRKQEKALVKELEQAAKKAAERDRGYIKAEVKGTLRYEPVDYPAPTGRVKCWTITAEDVKWALGLPEDKAMLERTKGKWSW